MEVFACLIANTKSLHCFAFLQFSVMGWFFPKISQCSGLANINSMLSKLPMTWRLNLPAHSIVFLKYGNNTGYKNPNYSRISSIWLLEWGDILIKCNNFFTSKKRNNSEDTCKINSLSKVEKLLFTRNKGVVHELSCNLFHFESC